MVASSQHYYLFIDLENLPHFSLDGYEPDQCTLFIFLGAKQANIPEDMLKNTGVPGDRVHQIRMAKSGKNNLDFHLTFYMGQCHERAPADVTFIILSDDTGFDPLIKYINQLGRSCHRDIPKSTNPENYSGLEAEVDKLKKELWLKNEDKRPASENKLKNHIAHFTKHQKLQTSPEKLFEALIREGIISTKGKKIIYHF